VTVRLVKEAREFDVEIVAGGPAEVAR
jgi:hypothetical protein